MLGFEPRTFCMQSRSSTTELHPQLVGGYWVIGVHDQIATNLVWVAHWQTLQGEVESEGGGWIEGEGGFKEVDV